MLCLPFLKLQKLPGYTLLAKAFLNSSVFVKRSICEWSEFFKFLKVNNSKTMFA